MKKISMAKITELFAAINATQSVYAPIEKANQVNFAKWEDGAALRLDELKTVKSAKDLFFPQVEDIVKFTRHEKNITIAPAEGCKEKFVVFGVRGCDCKSFDILDSVFLADPVDTYYQARRVNGTVVTLACGEPEESCFCKVFGVDAAAPKGDVTTWIVDGELFWQANTEKGEALTEAVAGVLEDVDSAKVEAAQAEIHEIIEKLPYSNLSLEGFNGEAMMEKFNSEKWAELSEACIACGTCTFVCPTCQCYDVRDYDNGHGIQRFRCWDSCMRSDFTLMAHGNNRNSQLERFRQRFMHKLVYFPANNNGEYSCVGCGRCVNKCPISMNIVKVIKALGGEN